MIKPQFLFAFALAVFSLTSAFLCFSVFIDPYGVSPIQITVNHINRHKPARVNIDRLIKPYEVWRYQPKTIFLGTSRTQQGLDPSGLDKTRFAPAYNASIPASSIALNVAHLKQYLDLDPAIRAVFMELFFYPFIDENSAGDQTSYPGKALLELADNTKNLIFSSDTLRASIQTITYNLTESARPQGIAPGGNFHYPPGHNSKGGFDGFPGGIWNSRHSREFLLSPKLNEDSFNEFREIIRVCREHNIELIFFLAPNHAYEDYRLEVTGIWPVVEEWLRRVGGMARVYSFSQPNE